MTFTDRSKDALADGGLEHVFRLSYVNGAASGTLDVESASVTFDEGWSPHVQAGIQCPVPEDQDVLDALDGRTGCRLLITMGYRFPDGTEETTNLDLGLRDRAVNRPENTMNLSASSDEALVQDAVRITSLSPGNPPTTGVREALTWLLDNALVEPPTVAWGIDYEYGPELLTELTVPTGTPFWDAVTTVTDPAEVWIRDDGTRTWQVGPRPTRAGSASHQVFVGPVGNLIGSETLLSRDGEFYNVVVITHIWEDALGVEHRRRNGAWVTSGPYSITSAGLVSLEVRRSTPTSAASNQRAAEAMVRRSVSRGRSMSLVTPSPYWVRPGQTITAQLPTGPQERHLVAAASFRWPAGEASIRTRVPVDVTIESGE